MHTTTRLFAGNFTAAWSRSIVRLAFVIAVALSPALSAPANATPDQGSGTDTTLIGVPSSQTLTAPTMGHDVLAARAARKAPVSRRAARTSVLEVAASKAGAPYAYGATGPNAFDCSGFTSWVYDRVGKNLPRTSDAQAGATIRVKNPRPGDLVFFHNNGNVYHVGIYAGGWTLWHASRPGTPVARTAIWTRSVFFGRVR